LLEVLVETIDEDVETSKVVDDDAIGIDELAAEELVVTETVKEVDVSRQVLDDSVVAVEAFDTVVGTITGVVILVDGAVEVETGEEDSAVESDDDAVMLEEDDDAVILEEDDDEAELVIVSDVDFEELVEVGVGVGVAVETSTTVTGTVISITE
jgi:hypothetical protein